MMKTMRRFGLIVLSLVALGTTEIVRAACPGATIETPGNCLYAGGFSAVGGDLLTASQRVLASNMDPFQRQATEADLAYWKKAADDGLTAGKTFRDGLLLIGATPNDGTARGRLLNDPKLNYQSVGLLTNLAGIEAGLLSARDTYAYLLYRGYPDAATARANLLDTIKTLANLYLMIADEFLIDALEWRFSADTLNVDQKLDEQITLLQSAQDYYQKAIGVFVYGFSPAVGTNIYVSASFDDAVFSLFNIGVERLSLALRELSSKQLVRQMAPDANEDWAAARGASLATLKGVSTTAYLLTGAIAKTQGATFDAVGGGSSIVGALSALRKQGNIYNQGLNPLGYDNRYAPMQDFSALYSVAAGGLNAAKGAKADFDSESRAFDSNQEALRQQVNALISQYVTSLAALTGCAEPTDFDDPQQIESFLVCTGESGGDLFDCRLAQRSGAFETCVGTKSTAGVLAQKYRDTMAAQIRLNAARLGRDNVLTRIDLANEKANRQVTLKRRQTGAQTRQLNDYYRELKGARTVTDTATITTNRKWDSTNKHWDKSTKEKDHKTSTTFNVSDDTLQIRQSNEQALLEITTDFEIQQVNLETAYVIKDLLLSAAEAEIEVQLAVQQKNSAIADFDNSLQEKENLWQLYQRALNQLSYYTERSAPLRILKSQATIVLADRINYTAHYAYLAAKALEYQHLMPLVDEPVGGGRLRITDLFKAQTTSDLEAFLLKLNALGTTQCPWGTFDPQYQVISLAYHILGLTDRYLDPDGDGQATPGKSIAQARREAVQGFIIANVNAAGHLHFPFTIAENASFLASSHQYNLKLWSGPAPSSCDPLVTPVLGTAINIISTQSGNFKPKMRLRQTGHSSLRNGFGEVVSYIPISNFHFLFEGGGDFVPYKEAEFVAYTNATDPRTQSGGAWTGGFKGRSISASNWEVELFDWNVVYPATDLSKITDIQIHMDTIGECCY